MRVVGHIDRDRLARVRAREQAAFDRRTERSAELTARARRHMPDGVPMAWMAGLYDHGPLYVAHGDGCRFTDVDGNAYVDFNQADLSATCGFAPPAVLDAIAERAADGLQFLLPVEEAIVAAELLAERYGLPGWQFTLAASGANAEAIRIARHRTGRTLLVVFGGHYHGHLDDTLVTGDERSAQPELLGLNPRAAADTRVVAFNDLAALERVLAAGDVAAVITEPVLTNVGVVQPDDGFLAGVRALAHAHGALLILDETHTQTAAYGGLTRAWGLDPDLVTLGKSLGGGVPIGAYGMTGDLREWMERHRAAHGRTPGIATGGTTYASPLSLAAAVAVLREIQTPAAFDRTADARRPARRRDRGRRGALRPAVARAPARRALGLLPRARAPAHRRRRRALARRGADRHPAAPHGQPRRLGRDRQRGPGRSFAHAADDVDEYLRRARGLPRRRRGLTV